MTARVPGGKPAALAQDETEDGDDLADAAGGAPGQAMERRLVVDAGGSGERLDKYLAEQWSDVSRSRIQRWMGANGVLRNGKPARARDIVYAGDAICIVEAADPQGAAYRPEPMDLAIVHEDEAIIVIDKPAGLVVHPGAGNWSATLLNGLLAHDARLAAVPRAGIVHRLDAGTSGLLVVARSVAVQLDLVRQLQERSVVREYWALAAGAVDPSVTIDAALGRDPRNALRFRVSRALSARPARTYVRRLALWRDPQTGVTVSWVVCRLDTGRTHQIRVHLESIGHPLLGDPLYRRHLPAPLLAPAPLAHQALHAFRLEFVHPLSGQSVSWTAGPPADMKALMRRLGASAAQLRPPAQVTIRLPQARVPDEDD